MGQSREIGGTATDRVYSDALRLVNVENGMVITQLTLADFQRLRRDTDEPILAGKLDLFIAWLEGEKRARVIQRGERP